MGQSCAISSKSTGRDAEGWAFPHNCEKLRHGAKQVINCDQSEIRSAVDSKRLEQSRRRSGIGGTDEANHDDDPYRSEGSKCSPSCCSSTSTASTAATRSSFSWSFSGSSSLSESDKNRATHMKDLGDRSSPSYKLADAQSKSSPGLLQRESMRPPRNGCRSTEECIHGKSGDCLPLDGMVWVDGQNFPQPLTNVTTGQRVLCHDMAFGGFKYAEIENNRVHDEGTVEWVEIKLQDGTCLRMTADHPMQAQGIGTPIRAGDLKPSQDSIMVLKCSPVPVKRIRKVADVGAKRVFCTVEQPTRHTLLVSKPGQSDLMTVGSADLSEIPSLQTKRTFLDMANEGPGQQLRRSNSSPQLADLPSWAGSERESCDDLLSTVSPETITSFEGADDIIIAPGDRDGCVKITDLIKIQSMGLRSHGSVNHRSGRCKVCIFENRRMHDGGPPCFKGRMCEFCHEPHAKSSRLKKRGTRAGHWRSDKRAISQA